MVPTMLRVASVESELPGLAQGFKVGVVGAAVPPLPRCHPHCGCHCPWRLSPLLAGAVVQQQQQGRGGDSR